MTVITIVSAIGCLVLFCLAGAMLWLVIRVWNDHG